MLGQALSVCWAQPCAVPQVNRDTYQLKKSLQSYFYAADLSCNRWSGMAGKAGHPGCYWG